MGFFDFFKGIFRKKEKPTPSRESIIASKLKSIFREGRKDPLREAERILIEADTGIDVTLELLENISKDRAYLKDYEALETALKREIRTALSGSEKGLSYGPGKSIILVCGVNGTGKTTTCAKLALLLKNRGEKPALAAADTYRAAAGEQLDIWAQRISVRLYRQDAGADPASVVFDAVTSFQKNPDHNCLIIDTGGRLHNNENLLHQLEKIRKVIHKASGSFPAESLLILDGNTGQNAVNQTETFMKVSETTGLIVTKMDGTAKAGILINLYKKFGIPIKFIGTGENAGDLKAFSVNEYIERIFF